MASVPLNFTPFISKFGAILSALYLVLAIAVVREDRRTNTGGWINLQGMTSYLATFPVSAPAEWLGRKLDFRSNTQMGFAIGICAMLVYILGLGLAKLADLLFHGGGQ